MANKQTERSRKVKKKVISISDSEEYVLHGNKKQEKNDIGGSEVATERRKIENKQKPRSRKRKKQIVSKKIISDSEESDDSDNKYVPRGNKKQKTNDIDDSEEATGSEDELSLADRIRKVISS